MCAITEKFLIFFMVEAILPSIKKIRTKNILLVYF